MFTSYLVCLDVAEQGDRIALGWGQTIESRLDAGRLVSFDKLSMPVPNAICAYRPSGQPTNPVVDEFVALLKGRLY